MLLKMNNNIMTAKEVSEVFFEGKWSYQKVLRWARNGDLPGLKAGKSYYFSRDVLQEWVRENMSTCAWAKVKV